MIMIVFFFFFAIARQLPSTLTYIQPDKYMKLPICMGFLISQYFT